MHVKRIYKFATEYYINCFVHWLDLAVINDNFSVVFICPFDAKAMQYKDNP
jgi:hypothetical protein